MNFVLIGPMGAGKSSVARVLSKRLGWEILDTDRWVCLEQKCEVTEIFAKHGEKFFRERESAALEASAGWQELIISTGGGIVLAEKNRELLKKIGFVVWLTASEEVLYERVMRNQRRPLLHTANPRDTLHEIVHSREGFYKTCARLKLDTSSNSESEIADEILKNANFP